MSIKNRYLELIRVEYSENHGTFGVLKLNGEIFCITLEAPWRGGLDKSCLPEGNHTLVRTLSEQFGQTFEVPNRCLLGRGNGVKEAKGNILVGERFAWLAEGRGIYGSPAAFDRLLESLRGQETVMLRITDADRR
jgi:hypothetical protein